MPSQKDERIAIRAFARYIGVTDTYVQKQIFDATKNPKGALKDSICVNEINKRRMLLKEMALTEWVAAGLTIKDKDVLAKLIPLIQQPQDPLWQAAPATGSNREQDLFQPVPTSNIKIPDKIVPLTEEGNVIHAGMGAYEAKAYKEIFAAGKLELDYRQKLGKLVEKDAVYKMLFEYGQEMRTAILQIPSRVTSNMLSCDTEREAQELLRGELELALTLLSRGPKQNTTQDEQSIEESTT